MKDVFVPVGKTADYRARAYASSRRYAVREEIKRLQEEEAALTTLIDTMMQNLCRTCGGEGYVMRPIPGCECDGPRMHDCDACKGTGRPTTQEQE